MYIYYSHMSHFCSASPGISNDSDNGKIWFILVSVITHLEGMHKKVGS